MNAPYRTSGSRAEPPPVAQSTWMPVEQMTRTVYKVLQVNWRSKGSHEVLEIKLNQSALEGWKPVLMSDSSGSYSIILERTEVLKEGER